MNKPKVLPRLLSVIDAISEYTGKFWSFLVVILTLTLVIEVIARYGFNRPIPGVHDAMTAFFGAHFVMPAAFTLLAKAHVNVDILYAHSSPRKKAIVDLLTAPAFFIFAAVIVYTGWGFAMDATWNTQTGWLLEYDHSHLHFPLYPVKWTIFLGGFLLLLQGLAKFVRDFGFAVTGKELA